MINKFLRISIFSLCIAVFFTGCLPRVSEEELAQLERVKQSEEDTILDQAIAKREEFDNVTSDHDSGEGALELQDMPEQPTGIPDESVDIDLTVMSSIMVYSEVYNIVVNPDSYIGKSIKLEGFFQGYSNPTIDKNYYFVIVPDATACCEQGLEVIVEDELYSYPSDGEEVQVKGTFELYEETGNMLFRIRTEAVTPI